MSVLINMNMPTRCSDCEAFVCYRQYAGDSGDCFCGITKSDAKGEVRNADCPLIPVPPHGRLGDFDALQKEFEEDANFYDEMHGEPSEFDRQRTEIQYTIERIKNAPTIIEAEDVE